jgi:hypothetical protein
MHPPFHYVPSQPRDFAGHGSSAGMSSTFGSTARGIRNSSERADSYNGQLHLHCFAGHSRPDCSLFAMSDDATKNSRDSNMKRGRTPSRKMLPPARTQRRYTSTISTRTDAFGFRLSPRQPGLQTPRLTTVLLPGKTRRHPRLRTCERPERHALIYEGALSGQ